MFDINTFCYCTIFSLCDVGVFGSVIRHKKCYIIRKNVSKNYEMVFNFKMLIYWAGGVAQVIEHLPSKCKALSSNASTTTKINK
jgi:hypothetical protein